jgi:hypothetical protein
VWNDVKHPWEGRLPQGERYHRVSTDDVDFPTVTLQSITKQEQHRKIRIAHHGRVTQIDDAARSIQARLA